VVSQLAAELGISRILATVLANRGVADPREAQEFLDPSLSHLHDPLHMRGMTEAIFQLANAVRSGTRILVWGDYDVDGVTATALLVDFLRRHTPAVSWHIPHRLEAGYGLEVGALRRHAQAGVGLVVTVDCGISDAAAVAAGRALGLRFVITDHHEPPPELPPAEAVLNPRRPGCPYPFKHLAGVAIAFKLAQGLARLIGPGDAHGADRDLSSYLDLVTLGTVADIAPLTGENRVLVKEGLTALGATGRPGLRALMDVAGITSRPLRAAHIGYALGPRINAAGRLDHADRAVELLLADDPGRGAALAAALDAQNRRRQEIEAAIMRDALAALEADPALREDRILVLSDPTWHPGVIGIVAAKLADRHARPAVLISTGAEPAKGSARSIQEVDLFAHLRGSSALLTAYGGHAHAAGIALRAADIPALRRELNRSAAADPALEAPARRLDIDAAVDFGVLRPALAEELRRLAPFGHRNPEPVFMTGTARLQSEPRTVGSNHLRLSLVQKPHARQFIGFGLGHCANFLATGSAVAAAYDLDLEGSGGAWQRYRLRDIRPPAQGA
jgi:single-stranded-DNA-specific exonuclease